MTEGEILNLSDEERISNFHSVLEFANHCSLDLYVTCLEFSLVSSAADIELLKNEYRLTNSDNRYKLKNLFDSVENLTAKEDLLVRLKNRLINLTATRLKFTKIFLGPTATRLAGQLLTAMGQGRGAQIGDEIVSI